jgi:hypothetical protein
MQPWENGAKARRGLTAVHVWLPHRLQDSEEEDDLDFDMDGSEWCGHAVSCCDAATGRVLGLRGRTSAQLPPALQRRPPAVAIPAA